MVRNIHEVCLVKQNRSQPCRLFEGILHAPCFSSSSADMKMFEQGIWICGLVVWDVQSFVSHAMILGTKDFANDGPLTSVQGSFELPDYQMKSSNIEEIQWHEKLLTSQTRRFLDRKTALTSVLFVFLRQEGEISARTCAHENSRGELAGRPQFYRPSKIYPEVPGSLRLFTNLSLEEGINFLMNKLNLSADEYENTILR